jgi:NADH:ubiquinone oxidoreductase subunit C
MNIVSNIRQLLPQVSILGYEKKNLILTLESENLAFVLTFLKLHFNTQFNLLTGIAAVDYPFRRRRFEVIFELLSVSFNVRARVKTFIDEATTLTSSAGIFSAATWWEREIWDFFGIFFEQNQEIKRILTDYGFVGHPMRKDFPLSGFVESRYDDTLKRVVSEPLEHAQEFRNFDFVSGWSSISSN